MSINPEEQNMLEELKKSMGDMQTNLESAYKEMEEKELQGKSHDGTVTILMTATYKFVDIQFDERALKGGVKEFKWRIREAWKNLTETITSTTQEQVMDMFKDIQVPESLQDLAGTPALEDDTKDEDEAEG